MFLAETWLVEARLAGIRDLLQFGHHYGVSIIYHSGGLAIFWKAGVDLEIVYFDRNVIASLVYFDPPSSPWLFLLIYGPPHANGKARFWKCLEDMVSAFAGPWLVMRAFNCI